MFLQLSFLQLFESWLVILKHSFGIFASRIDFGYAISLSSTVSNQTATAAVRSGRTKVLTIHPAEPMPLRDTILYGHGWHIPRLPLSLSGRRG
jgi:hypothetical protein